MSCRGMKPGDQVTLTSPIPKLTIPTGSVGTVLSRNEERHQVDIFFVRFGIFRGLDPHAFLTLEAEDAAPPTPAGESSESVLTRPAPDEIEAFDPKQWVDHIEHIHTIAVNNRKSRPVRVRRGAAPPMAAPDDEDSSSNRSRRSALNAAIHLANKDKR